MRLAVELYGTTIGTLEGDARSFDFTPSNEGIARFGPASPILSTAVPLALKQRRDLAPRRRNWFAELLPEGAIYSHMLAQAQLRPGDTLGFLAHYGRDVAGALQIWDLDDPTEPREPAHQKVSAKEIRSLLEEPSRAPLANDPRGGRSSLGGVQPKIVLVHEAGAWHQALGGYPTTHILKPQLPSPHASVIFNEEYGSRLARRLGLSHFPTAIEEFAGLPTLVIERFDRHDGARIHQEDFNQALGASRDEKYQEIGGRVSLRRIAETLIAHTPSEDIEIFARMVVFAVGIGNLDMHAKNIALLHRLDDHVRLADAYDTVPQAHLDPDGRLAMAVNGRYLHRELTHNDLVAELSSWGLRGARRIVNTTLEELRDAAIQESPLEDSSPELQSHIAGYVSRLLDGQPAD